MKHETSNNLKKPETRTSQEQEMNPNQQQQSTREDVSLGDEQLRKEQFEQREQQENTERMDRSDRRL